MGTQGLDEEMNKTEKNKYNINRESLSSYFYVNVLVRKGPHLGSHKKKVLADLQVRASKLSLQMEDLKEVK